MRLKDVLQAMPLGAEIVLRREYDLNLGGSVVRAITRLVIEEREVELFKESYLVLPGLSAWPDGLAELKLLEDVRAILEKGKTDGLL